MTTQRERLIARQVGLLGERFVTGVDIWFLSLLGWSDEDLASLPYDVVKALVASEMTEDNLLFALSKIKRANSTRRKARPVQEVLPAQAISQQ